MRKAASIVPAAAKAWALGPQKRMKSPAVEAPAATDSVTIATAAADNRAPDMLMGP